MDGPLSRCILLCEILLKFEHSEKHTKTEKKIIIMVLTNQLIYLVNIKTMSKIFPNYVCFSKSPNFKTVVLLFFFCDGGSSRNAGNSVEVKHKTTQFSSKSSRSFVRLLIQHAQTYEVLRSTVIVKFVYSEKATKVCEISTNYFSYVK